MGDALALLGIPFAAAVVLVAIHTYFGIQVLTRNIVFVDLALAQVAALGATVAFMLGHAAQGVASYAYSLAFTLGAALLLTFSRRWAGRVSQEALIGVIYVVAAAAAFLLVDRAPQGAEHIKQILTGSILTVGAGELLAITALYAVVGALHVAARERITRDSWGWDFFFYATFGLVVTSSVALAGVLLVFSFLIIPAAIGLLCAQRLARQLAVGWAAGVAASLAGLLASYAWDLPTGAAMVCAFGLALALTGLAKLRVRWAAARYPAAFVLVLSGAWLIAAPRADHPLLDGAELALPAIRSIYMGDPERAAYVEAGEQAERYRREGEMLNEREARSRWEGKALEEMEVRRISSFLKSYGEMRKGEQFVMREVRARARERVRWTFGGALLAAGLLLVPWRRLRPPPRA
jgi:zinc/manganese transport system permease protein